MAVKQPSYIQASSHPADTDRLVLEGLMGPAGAPVSGALYGVGAGPTELQVTQNGTPNMSVNVAAGHVWIDGTENSAQGTYHFYNDATVNVAITAANATNPRKDLIVARIRDAAYSGASNTGAIEVVTGTAAASPAEPAVPANSVVLALVDVAASAASITNANITDRRRRASALGGVVVCTSTTRPTTGLYEGLVIYETDTDKCLVYNGSGWIELAPAGAWTAYTPTLTATTTNPTLGSGSSVSGRYTRRGRQISGWAKVVFGTSGTAAGSGNYEILLPATAEATVRNIAPVGQGWIGGTDSRLVTALTSVDGNRMVLIHEGGEVVTHAAPWAWAASYSLQVSFDYEAAS